MSLSERIKKFRQQKGLSQDKLAYRAGVSFSTLAKIEAGIAKQPILDTVVKLADALEVSLDELIGRKPPKKKA